MEPPQRDSDIESLIAKYVKPVSQQLQPSREERDEEADRERIRPMLDLIRRFYLWTFAHGMQDDYRMANYRRHKVLSDMPYVLGAYEGGYFAVGWELWRLSGGGPVLKRYEEGKDGWSGNRLFMCDDGDVVLTCGSLGSALPNVTHRMHAVQLRIVDMRDPDLKDLVSHNRDAIQDLRSGSELVKYSEHTRVRVMDDRLISKLPDPRVHFSTVRENIARIVGESGKPWIGDDAPI